MSDDDRYERGRARFLEVHDEKALAAVEGLGDLGRMIVEIVYGDVYSRSELSTRDRELVTVAALVSLGRSAQLPQHLLCPRLKSCIHSGCTGRKSLRRITEMPAEI